jgi:hypothetical protein
MEENKGGFAELLIAHGFDVNVESVMSVMRGRWLTFRGAEELAVMQTGFAEYTPDMPCYRVMRDMIRVMAEVYMVASRSMESKMDIGGEERTAGMVADIYMEIKAEDLERLCEKIGSFLPKVNSIKSYLRAAIYNTVFEGGTDDERATETVKRDMGWR